MAVLPVPQAKNLLEHSNVFRKNRENELSSAPWHGASPVIPELEPSYFSVAFTLNAHALFDTNLKPSTTAGAVNCAFLDPCTLLSMMYSSGSVLKESTGSLPQLPYLTSVQELCSMDRRRKNLEVR